MARRLRIDVAGVPQHVIQRGVNRSACFFDKADYRFYRTSLQEAASQNGCRIHAYVLMTNHVHLLVTGKIAGSISSTMQCLGRRYVRWFNRRHDRSGTLWEGRFKSCLIDTEHYLLTCYRYIEMNPVRAYMVAAAADYRWSSVHANAGDAVDPLIDPHPVYMSLDDDPDQRKLRYRELLERPVSEQALTAVRQYVNQGGALGSPRFQHHIKTLTGREARARRPGRPWVKG